MGGSVVEEFKLAADSSSRDLVPIALAVHAVLSGLPVTIRSRNNLGVQVEEGEVKSRSYTGPILERVLAENNMIKTRPETENHQNGPVIVAPIRDSAGSALAAIGVVDVPGIFQIARLMRQHSQLPS